MNSHAPSSMGRAGARCALAVFATLVSIALAGGCDPQVATLSTGGQHVIDSPEAAIQSLGDAYARRDYDQFAALLSQDPGSKFTFSLPEPLPSGDDSWGVDEELRIHRRMFRPRSVPAGETPLPDSLWLSGITISLSPNRDWEERTDLYKSPSNPEGLDDKHWKAVGAEWHASIFFETAGSTDYSVDDRSYFVVLEDLSKAIGTEGKFVIYRWEDLGATAPKAAQVEQRTWAGIKVLYDWSLEAPATSHGEKHAF